MSDPICPAGMVLQKPEGAVHPDEPVFCIEKTEVPQLLFMSFLREKNREAFDTISKLLDRSPKEKGDKKPAVYGLWDEAQDYCKATYRGGDLPTERQWENACGSGKYCTASRELNHREAIYDADGPADVDGPGAEKRVNKRGVQDMAGNVWEWIRDDVADRVKRLRGGSWLDGDGSSFLRADYRHYGPIGLRSHIVGLRCVAPPLNSLPAGQVGKKVT